jgi:isopenicillin N synthase-like dioxygenase
MTVLDNFTSIPILNYALLSSPDTRPVFIKQLQNALINVGFLYLEHPPVADALIDKVTAYLPRVFALPQERKDALRMANSPHFLGYSRLGVERTKGAADQREQFDIATPFECTWRPGEPDYLRLWGPSQVRFFFSFDDDLRRRPPTGPAWLGRGCCSPNPLYSSINIICITDVMMDDSDQTTTMN